MLPYWELCLTDWSGYDKGNAGIGSASSARLGSTHRRRECQCGESLVGGGVFGRLAVPGRPPAALPLSPHGRLGPCSLQARHRGGLRAGPCELRNATRHHQERGADVGDDVATGYDPKEEGSSMRLAPIRTEKEHQQALARVETLFGVSPGTPEADELEVISLLVERYEQARFPVSVANAIEAIRFRMQQERLSPRDLEPYIGSRGRVSEVLSGARPLSIDMIRALNWHLGIPAESLLQASEAPESTKNVVPSKPAMNKLAATGLMRASEDFRGFLERAFGKNAVPALLRKTRTDRTNAKTDLAALQAWCAAAILKSYQVKVAKKNVPHLGCAEAEQLAHLSTKKNGLKKARKLLAEWGIALVFLEHLPGTYLDGAAMCRSDGVKIIALTLRYDRIDNFWFTLLHEFAHVALHLNEEIRIVLDDLEIRSSAIVEEEADRFAQQALISDELWRSRVRAEFSAAEVQELAQEAGVHPAIVAGRWQREFRDYRLFSKLLGHGEVREQALSI